MKETLPMAQWLGMRLRELPELGCKRPVRTWMHVETKRVGWKASP